MPQHHIRNYSLTVTIKTFRLCFFIQPNWLLVWEINNQELILVLLNTGTHSDLFGKKYKKG